METKRSLDVVEQEYERAISLALNCGNNAWAYELSIGLKQYRDLYKLETETT